MNTFDLIEKGDLVCRREKYSVDIRLVEGLVKGQGENNNVLLVNGVADVFYEGKDIDIFNQHWKLIVKSKDINWEG